MYRIKIRSRHPSHNTLRHHLPKVNVKSVVRLGSITDLPDTITNGGTRVEINTIQSIKNSSSKLLMKECFDRNQVKTAKWFKLSNQIPEGFEFPLVIKSHYGSRGLGNTLVHNIEEYNQALKNKNANNYIVEQYMNFNKEYRLHVTKDGCFYTCRKMLKSDTEKDKRWLRNDSTCVWILEDNELFDKPVNWNDIVKDCINALNSLGLDVGAMDVRVQSSKNKKGTIRENPEWIIIEANSAPSFGEQTAKKYLEIIPTLINSKKNN